MARDGGTEDVEKMAFVLHKEEQKGKLSRVLWWKCHGSRHITRPLLKNRYSWWENLRAFRVPPQGILDPKLLGPVQ